jgi:hypothetical protein
MVLAKGQLYNLLHATISSLSSPVFVIFHDPRADLISLQKLGFDASTFTKTPLASLAESRLRLHSQSKVAQVQMDVVVVADTQKLYSAWKGAKKQIGLGEALKELNVPTRRLHNAGNDAK